MLLKQQHVTRTSHFSGMRLFSRVKTLKLCKIILITRKRRQADWRFDPFFIDSKNSSDLRFRDGFAADSPLQRGVRLSTRISLPRSRSAAFRASVRAMAGSAFGRDEAGDMAPLVTNVSAGPNSST